MESIEQRAEELLAELEEWIWDGATPPVPIDEIVADHFGLYVRECPPEELGSAPGAPPLADGQTLSGLLLASRGEIWINAEEARQWPGRRRFTIAHELGHWVMHRRPGQQSLFCRHGTVDPDDAIDRPTVEEEADIFAAALTMPAELVRREYERLRHEAECHARMCERFAASEKAMGRRMQAVVPRGS